MVAAHQLMERSQGHLSGHRVLVAEVEFCKEPPAVNQQLDEVNAGSPTETQISGRGERVTEGLSAWYATEDWKIGGY